MTQKTYKTSLTRRAFEIVAESVAAAQMPDDVRRQVASQIADRLASTNDRFDRERFVKACGVN